MDEMYWDGNAGWAASGNTRHTLINNPLVAFYSFDYINGAGKGIESAGGDSVPLDADSIAVIQAQLKEVAAFDSAPVDHAYGMDANGNYLGLVPHSEVHINIGGPMPAGRQWQNVAGTWLEVLTLDQAKNFALSDIDTAAGSARLRYITDVPGQQAVYMEKLAQSQAFLAAPSGKVPPYVQAEATAMATDTTTAANYILQTAAAWNNQLSPAIEQARRLGKIAIANAGSNTDVDKFLAQSIATLKSI